MSTFSVFALLPLAMCRIAAQLSLWVDLTTLLPLDLVVVDVGIPGLDIAQEHIFDLFKGLASGFGEHEEDMDRHRCAEDAKDNIDLPLDRYECGRNEVGKREVEDPVGGGCKCDGLASDT